MSTESSDSSVAAQDEKQPLALEIKVDQPSACERHVTVTIPRADIDRYVGEAVDELRPKAEVPGFRPGRAPRKLVESRFQEQVAEQVKGSLLMDSMTQVSDDCDFSAISEPDFDFDAIELPAEGEMTFEFNIEVRPEFDLPEWENLDIEQPVHEYTDEEVDGRLDSLLGRYGQHASTEEPAAEDDQLKLNVTFRRDGEVISTLEEESVRLMPKLSFANAQMDNFGELLTGAKVGDTFTASLTISDEAENESLRGQEVDADFEVLNVLRLEKPEVNEEFLNKIGGFEHADQLRTAVRAEMERQFTYHQNQKLRQQVTEQLTADANWDLPPDLLKRQASRELERAVLELQSSGFSQEVIRAHANQLRQNAADNTKRALQEHFILERIAEENDIEADPEDFEREVMMIALQRNESPRRVRARMEKQGQMDTLRNQILERKVVDLIASKANITETEFEPEVEDTAGVDHAI
ncbi:MAG: trigger factor, partial [Pirellulaceae bacterium]|nr:trigger factor [Pirellulaceae bacterium]